MKTRKDISRHSNLLHWLACKYEYNMIKLEIAPSFEKSSLTEVIANHFGANIQIYVNDITVALKRVEFEKACAVYLALFQFRV